MAAQFDLAGAFANTLGSLSNMRAQRDQSRHEDERLSWLKEIQAYNQSRDVPIGVLKSDWETGQAKNEETKRQIQNAVEKGEALKRLGGADWEAKTFFRAMNEAFPGLFPEYGAAPDSGAGAVTSPVVPSATATADDIRMGLFGAGFPPYRSPGLPPIGPMQGPPGPPEMQGPPAPDWEALFEAMKASGGTLGGAWTPQPGFDDRPLQGAWARRPGFDDRPLQGAWAPRPGFDDRPLHGAWGNDPTITRRTWDELRAEHEMRQAERERGIQMLLEQMNRR